MNRHSGFMQARFPGDISPGTGLFVFWRSAMKIKTICIDPGHGGLDNGAAYGYAEEDDINLSVAYLLRCALERDGHEIIMTREADMYVSLENRCALANTFGADIFISIHCDAWHKETTKGISTHMWRGANYITEGIATPIHRALLERFPTHVNRGLKLSDFCVLHHTKMPAVLVECEFISNPDMRKFLLEPENQFAIANAIAKGIEESRPQMNANEH
jgi:N-acetylmuramoyl-L-alanine amidase